MTHEEHEGYPEDRSVSDWLVPATKGGVGAVPIIGGLLGEIVGLLWTPALQRRQAEWFKALGNRVEEVEAEVKDLKERLQREEVLTVAVNAARAATATHEETKREALRNAVINSALDIEPDSQMQLVFVGMVDRLTAGHLQLLELFDNPARFFERRQMSPPSFTVTSSLGELVKTAFRAWDTDLYARLAADLDQEGLAQASGLNTTMTAGGAMRSRTTSIGKRFLRFITH
jgi:hypothetical protein